MKINIHTLHPSAFISSTFLDLEQERKAVANVLRELNLNINALDVLPASNNSSKNEIQFGIKASDFIILIVGERYGAIIPEMTGSTKSSITKWEYLIARLSKKPALVYFKKVESSDPRFYDNRSDSNYKIKCEYLANFKKELSSRHNPKYFTTAGELVEEVRKAIIPAYRAGVKSLLEKNEKLIKEKEILSKKNEELIKDMAHLKQGILKSSSVTPSVNLEVPRIGVAPPKSINSSPLNTDSSFRGLASLAYNPNQSTKK